MSWRVVPRDEISRIELADKGISEKTASIVREERGYPKAEIHAVPHLVRGLEAEVPTVQIRIRGEKGDLVRQRDLSGKKYFWSGCSPFRQDIQGLLRENDANFKITSLDEICDYVVNEKKHLEDKYENRGMIKKLVIIMTKAGQVMTSFGNYKSGGVPLPLRRKVREVEEGFDPDMAEIFDFVKRKGNFEESSVLAYRDAFLPQWCTYFD
ncbi:unnamed protein product [marine sediment metagenome]|uniref:Uncharacterized protein n=1 Tax=marine sediment metagenome TaxID=412755 RepID=X1G8M6_9ZZZZ